MTLTHEQVLDLAAAYVLGALEPEEVEAVREHLATCDLAHDEIEQLGGVVPYLAETVDQVEPRASLRARVLAAAAADLATRATAAPPAAPAPGAPAPGAPAPAAPVVPFPTAEERAARRRTSPATWLMRIAAVLVIVALGAWNVLLQQQVNTSRDYDSAVAAVLDLAARQGSQTAVLSGANGQGPRGIAAVGIDGSIRIAMRDLAPTSGTQVYEAWAITTTATAPIPIGGFTVAGEGTGVLTASNVPPEPGVTLALTLEHAAGATTPTLPILSRGKATAPPPSS